MSQILNWPWGLTRHNLQVLSLNPLMYFLNLHVLLSESLTVHSKTYLQVKHNNAPFTTV